MSGSTLQWPQHRCQELRLLNQWTTPSHSCRAAQPPLTRELHDKYVRLGERMEALVKEGKVIKSSASAEAGAARTAVQVRLQERGGRPVGSRGSVCMHPWRTIGGGRTALCEPQADMWLTFAACPARLVTGGAAGCRCGGEGAHSPGGACAGASGITGCCWAAGSGTFPTCGMQCASPASAAVGQHHIPRMLTY